MAGEVALTPVAATRKLCEGVRIRAALTVAWVAWKVALSAVLLAARLEASLAVPSVASSGLILVADKDTLAQRTMGWQTFGMVACSPSASRLATGAIHTRAANHWFPGQVSSKNSRVAVGVPSPVAIASFALSCKWVELRAAGVVACSSLMNELTGELMNDAIDVREE